MFKEINKTAIWTIYVLVLILIISLGYKFLMYKSASTIGKMDADIKTASGDSRIFSYNHFFDLCASIQGYEASIAAQSKIIPNVEGEELMRVRTNIASIEAQRVRAIVQYNADSAKIETVGRFKNNNLPQNLNPLDKVTKCVY